MQFLKLAIFTGLLTALTATYALADQTIYLVRHAEKETGSSDPALTELGHKRAETIAAFLADRNIQHVFSTDYKRTRQTATPFAKAKSLNVTLYDPRALKAFADSLKMMPENSLVVGHSNTTPYLVGLLTNTEQKSLSEHQYDHIYAVTIKDDGTTDISISYTEPRTP